VVMCAQTMTVLALMRIAEYHPPPRSHDEEYTISRRQAIGAIIALPLVLLTTVRTKHVRLAPEEFLPQCAASLTACWNQLKRS
jgi:hypothetical protein